MSLDNSGQTDVSDAEFNKVFEAYGVSTDSYLSAFGFYLTLFLLFQLYLYKRKTSSYE